jgi:phenylacetate-coenzyme A ligase PaaK-like adenylate-forming protein
MDDRLRVKEMPLYAAQVAAVLAATRAAGRAFHLTVERDRIVLAVELSSDLFGDTVERLASLKHEIESEFHSRLGIGAEVGFVSPRRPAD